MTMTLSEPWQYVLEAMSGEKQRRCFNEEALPEASSSYAGPATKRARYSAETAEEQTRHAKEVQGDYVIRPGIPAATSSSSFYVADKPSPPLRPDDKDGHYVYELGENISCRYKILSKMGEGTFGRVLECWDRKLKDCVAIKIVRNVDKYRHAAMIELEVLSTLERNDPSKNKHCVSLREWFDYRGHVCMVFEKLGPSLYDYLRKNNYRPFPVDLVQSFARQLLESVAFMHDLRLIHTDLKPENILLVALDWLKCGSSSAAARGAGPGLPPSSEIRVIDFGSATFEDQYHSSIVSTRHYRAPEVILGLGWSYPCDMWSVGCIILELLTGDALFQTHENLEHLAMMEQVMGPIPERMAKACNKHSAKYFYKGKLNWPAGATSRKSAKAVKRLASLKQTILGHGHVSAKPYVDEICDLLSKMLKYEPQERMQAKAALQHSFFDLKLPVSLA